MLMRTLGCVRMFTKSFSQLLLGHYNGTEKVGIPQFLDQPKYRDTRSFSSFLDAKAKPRNFGASWLETK